MSACSGNAQSDTPDDGQADSTDIDNEPPSGDAPDANDDVPISGTETENPVSCAPPPQFPVTPTSFCEQGAGLSRLLLSDGAAEFVPLAALSLGPRGLVLQPDGIYAVADNEVWRITEDGNAEQVLVVEQPLTSDISFGQARTQLFFADLNDNGERSIIVGHRSDVAGFSAFRETNSGYERVFQSTQADDPGGIAVADFTGDGLPDIAAVPKGRVLLWRNEGNYAFSESATAEVNFNWAAHALFSHDVDDDGDQDLVAIYSITAFANDEPHPSSIVVHENDGQGNFILTPLDLPTDEGFLVVADQLGDVNGDSFADVVWASQGRLWITYGDGTGFTTTELVATSDLTKVQRLSVGDTDGDDIAEIIYLGNDPGLTAPFTSAAILAITADGIKQRGLPPNVGRVGSVAISEVNGSWQLYASSFVGRPCSSSCETQLFGTCAECVSSDDCASDARICVSGDCKACTSDNDCDGEHWCRDGVCERAVSTSDGWVSVAASYRAGCGVKENGSIECWGASPPTPPEGNFRSIVITLDELAVACALDAGGEITCFPGENGRMEQVPPTLPSGPFVQLDASGFYTCGLRADGSVACFDQDGVYEASGDFTQLSADFGYTCLLDGVGGVSCFDRDPNVTWASLGSMQVPDVQQPVMFPAAPVTAVPSGVALRRLAVGQSHACGLQATEEEIGPVVCWGSGRGVIEAPQAEFRDIEAGTFLTCGIDADGAVTCWGEPWRPRQTGFVSLSIRGAVPCGILDDGRFECQALELP